MPLGENVASVIYSPRGEYVRSVPVVSSWRTVIDPGGMVIVDAATILDPTTQITSSTRHLYIVDGLATSLVLRMAYDSTSTTITSPVVKVFGRTRSDIWAIVRTASAGLSATISATLASDLQNGAYLYTNPTTTLQTFPILGFTEILVGVETALASVTGDPALAFLQARVY